MKYYFDVTEFFKKTVAVEANSLNEAKEIVDKAWSEGLINIDRKYPDDVEFANNQEEILEAIDEGFIDKEELATFDNSILSEEEKHISPKGIIKDKNVYSPQSYLELVTGNCYVVSGDNDIEFIEKILEEFDYCLWNYPVDETDHIKENEINVVPVDCMIYNNKTKEYEHVLRWFEVPEDIEI